MTEDPHDPHAPMSLFEQRLHALGFYDLRVEYWMRRLSVDADLTRLAQTANAACRAEPGDRHAPEACPCKDGHDYVVGGCTRCGGVSLRGCHRCDARLRAWPDLAESDREHFREQMRPALAVLAEVRVAEREACAAILDADRPDEERRRAAAEAAGRPGDATAHFHAANRLYFLARAIRARGVVTAESGKADAEQADRDEWDQWQARAEAMLAAARAKYAALAESAKTGLNMHGVTGAQKVAEAVERAYASGECREVRKIPPCRVCSKALVRRASPAHLPDIFPVYVCEDHGDARHGEASLAAHTYVDRSGGWRVHCEAKPGPSCGHRAGSDECPRCGP